MITPIFGRLFCDSIRRRKHLQADKRKSGEQRRLSCDCRRESFDAPNPSVHNSSQGPLSAAWSWHPPICAPCHGGYIVRWAEVSVKAKSSFEKLRFP